VQAASHDWKYRQGNAFHTRWGLKSAVNGIAGVIVYTNTSAAGFIRFYIAATWEENDVDES